MTLALPLSVIFLTTFGMSQGASNCPFLTLTTAPVCWWDVSFAERTKGSEADLSAELLHLLREAVNSRMVADVPLGAFLSGGVDSSSVVALMAETSSDPVRTCSIGFDVTALDETAYASKVARLFGTDHRARTVGSEDFSELGNLAAMFDEPFADASALPTWRVCQLARESVTVALSGDGADEAFAGYRRQMFQARDDVIRAALPAPRRYANHRAIQQTATARSRRGSRRSTCSGRRGRYCRWAP